MTEPTAQERSRDTALIWGSTILTAVLLFFSFGPLGHPFLAFIALMPVCFAVTRQPSWASWRRASFLTSWILWIGLLIWLRHVYPPLGWLGLILLTAYCALFNTAWLIALRWILPALHEQGVFVRLLSMLGLAGAWGLMEWIRANFLTGFGWLPLAASQESNVVMLTLCRWVGPYGLSMALVLINLGLARWLHRFLSYRNNPALTPIGPAAWLQGLTPELYLGLSTIAAAFYGLVTQPLPTTRDTETIKMVAVQTNFDPNAKWDQALLSQHIGKITQATLDGAKSKPDIILWPEAAIPVTLEAPQWQTHLKTLAQSTNTTLVFGTIEKRTAGYTNSVAVMGPEGLRSPTYAKRHLVPFGEYVPLASILPLRKIVPIAEDCLAGDSVSLLPLRTSKGQTISAGALVCYEDVFPDLARDHARAGADLLIVITNDAWYGQEAGAYQHAAHSTLLAASTGLPLLRCGNAGWSGTIDRHGRSQAMVNPTTKSIYYAGFSEPLTAQVTLPEFRTPTFWVVHGDWAVGLGGMCFGLTYLWRRRFYREKSLST
jgi:apolipoprotein N-acyltransferase